MMAALEAGGMSVALSPTRERFNWTDGTYRPNSGGLYELEPAGMWAPTWPRQYDGRAIKVLTRWIRHLAVHEYRAIFMHRDAEEIRQSYRAAFSINKSLDAIETEQREALATLRNRRDVLDVQELDYEQALRFPIESLQAIDWPIDAGKAASVIDDSKYRFRKDRLVVGL